MSVDDRMTIEVAYAYTVSKARGLCSFSIVAACSAPRHFRLRLLIEKSKLVPRTRPNHELGREVDATGEEELILASSVVEEVLHMHENARWTRTREGIDGRERKRRVAVGTKGVSGSEWKSV